MPPRHGKSDTVSAFFPAWFLGRFPDKRVMLASYQAGFAAEWGEKARDILFRHGQSVFGVRVSPSTHARAAWRIEGRRGGMVTSGMRASQTGRGADVFIIDDPIKNALEARSKTIRDAIWDWYLSTAYTRLEPNGCIALIQTRWHQDDLAGRILDHAKQTGEAWEHINFAAIAEEGDQLGRAEGEALWPERYPLEVLEQIQRTQTAYWWSALYQGRPAPEEGSLFKRSTFRYFTVEDGTYVLHRPDGEPKRFLAVDCMKSLTADLAISLKTSADFTVMMVWALTPESDLLLLDVVRKRLEGPDQLALLHVLNSRWSPKKILIEGTQYQATLAQYAKRQSLPAVSVKVDKDKFSRAQNPAARLENGSVFFLQGAPWLDALESELLTFPRGAHDDQVDNLSMAGEYVSRPKDGISYVGAVTTRYGEKAREDDEWRDPREG